MNQSNVEHAAIGLILQATTIAAWTLLGWPHGDWAGAGLAVAAFIGREHAQREYQITKGGSVGGLKWYAGFFGWSKDSVMDVAAVIIACGVVVFFRSLA